MPTISSEVDFNGIVEKSARLSLTPLIDEARSTLDFSLEISLQKFANGTRGLRQEIDQRFALLGGWKKISSGGIDWTKSTANGATVGVEVQVSGRSDMLAVDIMHLKEQIEQGKADVGVIIVPDDMLSRYLTDRTPNLRTAIRHIKDRAQHLPIKVIAFHHDLVGRPLPKVITNLGSGRL